MTATSQATNKTRIVVAMSGGVDSSVAAALLKTQGYDVVGVSLKLWDYDEADRKLRGKTCCSLDDIADARAVCERLGMPFYAFNHKQAFEHAVITKFVSEYAIGRTPNPCVLCNQHIKFKLLLNEARKLGARYLATGHYARIVRAPDGGLSLAKALDPRKDQSYFLFHLTREDLDSVLFPLGDLTKSEVRAKACEFGLITQKKPESMEICFIPNNDHATFIAKHYPAMAAGCGNFVDRHGQVLGRHRGIEAYTVGQRRGLSVSLGRRMYVLRIVPSRNEVVLADEDEVFQQGAVAQGFHFIRPPAGGALGAKIRSQHDELEVAIERFNSDTGEIAVRFLAPARAITPGQALVIYEGSTLLGGGWIERAI